MEELSFVQVFLVSISGAGNPIKLHFEFPHLIGFKKVPVTSWIKHNRENFRLCLQ